ncbi:MAG TPA: phosphatase PAP2 family protein [Allosphingosinicella sp.]|nr:phosphatase PAP2 family protein [Allosphingosinicella sp.]
MARLIFPLTIGLLALVVLAALLLGGPETRVDPVVLAAFDYYPLVWVAGSFTHLGDVVTVFLAALLAAGWLLFRGHLRRALLLVGIVASERLLVEAMKNIFGRARPDPLGHEVAVHNMAFPSGHSANAMAGWLAIALLAASPRLRRPAVALALAIALITGLCRLVLQVHWPSDVVGGWAFGAAWTLLLVRLFGERRPSEGWGPRE